MTVATQITPQLGRSLNSLGISTSRGAYTSWEDVRVEIVTIPYGPGRSPDNSSDPDTDSDDSSGGLEELTLFPWVIWDRLNTLLWDPGNMTYWGWESLLCFTVSIVLPIALSWGGRFDGRSDSSAGTPTLTSFLASSCYCLQHLLFVGGVLRHSWEEVLFCGVGNVLRLPPTVRWSCLQPWNRVLFSKDLLPSTFYTFLVSPFNLTNNTIFYLFTYNEIYVIVSICSCLGWESNVVIQLVFLPFKPLPYPVPPLFFSLAHFIIIRGLSFIYLPVPVPVPSLLIFWCLVRLH